MLISFASLYFSLQLIFEYSYVFNEALIQNGTVQEREVIRLPLSRREPPVWVYEKSPLNPTAKITLTPRSLGAVLELAVDCFHFSTVTATTLGYGDILPNLWYTKLLADLQCLLGISIITISIGLYLRGRDIGTRKES